MNEERWIELEFNALRAELLALGQAERSAMKFYIPAASTVYAVPYFLLRDQSVSPLSHEEAIFLWTLCATVAGLLTLALVQSLYWSVDGARRIGMYIKEGLEPRTDRELRWETTLYQLYAPKRSLWPSESVTIAGSTLLTNLVTALTAGVLFLDGTARILPLMAAGLVSAFALPPLWRMARPSRSRMEYAARIAELTADFMKARATRADASKIVAPKLEIAGEKAQAVVSVSSDMIVGGDRLSSNATEKSGSVTTD